MRAGVYICITSLAVFVRIFNVHTFNSTVPYLGMHYKLKAFFSRGNVRAAKMPLSFFPPGTAQPVPPLQVKPVPKEPILRTDVPAFPKRPQGLITPSLFHACVVPSPAEALRLSYHSAAIIPLNISYLDSFPQPHPLQPKLFFWNPVISKILYTILLSRSTPLLTSWVSSPLDQSRTFP